MEDEGFTYDENPTGALRIMLRMAGYKDDEIDDELLAKAKAHYEQEVDANGNPVDEWPEVVGE